MNIQRRIIWILTLLVCAAPLARAQQPPAVPAKLADLIGEAERNNPRIAAARQAWRAATHVPSQVSTLPDPAFMVQHFSVGSPRPFAGYTNSDFAYLGFGVSQDVPYPGKLRLRGAIAEREADVARERIDSVRIAVVGDLKAAYFRIGYVAQTIAILERDADLLHQVEQAVEIRYRSGMGSQQAVLQAQLESTKLLREITTRQLEKGQLEAQLKQLLNRPQASDDIEAELLAERPLASTYDELLTAAKAQNPELRGAEKMIARQKLEVDLAHKDFYPDFNVQYMWQHNAEQFRDYYMFTFGVRVPIYRNRRQRQELAQAEAGVNQSRDEYEAQAQQTAAELRDQYVVAQKTAELLKMYREGLVPQARAEFQAALASYQGNREDFQALLASFEDVLRLDEEYWQNVADHETALARLEQLTGLELR
jgi:cobalt-zinc-cadmium efflux system outer membrane protein